MDWRDLHLHGKGRGPAFYLTALTYAQYLWQRGRAARAVLCLDRALGAELPPEPERCHALPYLALAWMLARVPPDVFIGNPRVHFQHLADKVRGPRCDLRRWRAWACWAIVRDVMPGLPGDSRRAGDEPSLEAIAGNLAALGCADEADLWRAALSGCRRREDS